MHQFTDDVLDISRQLFLKKAEDVRVLHVSHLTIVADYFIIASGRSDVHVRSLCDDVEKFMMEKGKQRLRIEGYREGRWVVLDYGDILIHVFHKFEREFYGLERLWVDGDNCLKITEEDVKPKE
jgi:ribosome-associated protein